jgi:hypothetical protein
MAAVHQAAMKSSAKAAGAQLAKWVSVTSGLVCAAMLAVGWSAFGQGRESGTAVGREIARKECAALAGSSWATTPEGRLAYTFAKTGGLDEVARCAGRGMVAKDGWCLVPSERGKPLARWPVPVGGVRSLGESP